MDIIKKVYEDVRMQLIRSLPMDNVIFLGLLREQKLLSVELKEQLEAKFTAATKTDLFLEKTIERSLYNVDDCKPLHDLLKVMSNESLNNDSLKELATKICQKMDGETLLPSTVTTG